MSSRKGASQFSSLMKDCVLWWPGSPSSASNTAKTVTANGNVTQSTAVLDPWGLARPVGYFDGNGDYLASWSTNSTTGNVCIDFWIYFLDNGIGRLFFQQGWPDHAAGAVAMRIGRSSANKLYYQYTSYYEWDWTSVTSSNVHLLANVWNHIRFVRLGSVAYVFLNGELDFTGNIPTNAGCVSSCNYIGVGYGQTNNASLVYHYGYISEVIISKNPTLLTTDAFTPPTSRFKPDQYTKLLLHMYGSGSTFTDDPFVDVNEFPIIPSGVTVTPNGTFYKQDLGNNKAVVKFDGSKNYITLSDNDAWTFGANNFSICFWVNNITLTGVGAQNYTYWIGQRASSDCRFMIYFDLVHSLGLVVYVGIDSTHQYNLNGGSLASTWNTGFWYHVSIIRTGNTLNVYRNGELHFTTAFTYTLNNIAAPLIIGTDNGSYYAHGYFKDLLIYKSRALTQPEIKLIMSRTHPITGAGLLPGGYDYWSDV